MRSLLEKSCHIRQETNLCGFGDFNPSYSNGDCDPSGCSDKKPHYVVSMDAAIRAHMCGNAMQP